MRAREDGVTQTGTAATSDAGAFRRAHFARVASPEVRAAIVGRLRLRGVPDQELGDVAADVEAALLAMASVPPTQDRCIGAARDVADKKAATRVRSLVSRAKHLIGPTPDADEHAGDADALPVAPAAFVREEMHRVVEASLADGTVDARTATMMDLQTAGWSIAAIAERLGVAGKTVRNALADGRRGVRAAWHARASTLGLA